MPETREPDSLTPLSEEELQAIEARAQAATPGPWGWTYDGSGDWSVGHVDDPQGRVVANSYNRAPGTPPDVEFIAHARSDVPRLLTELRRLLTEQEQRQMTLVGAECELARHVVRGTLEEMIAQGVGDRAFLLKREKDLSEEVRRLRAEHETQKREAFMAGYKACLARGVHNRDIIATACDDYVRGA